MTPPAAHQSSWESSEVIFGFPLLIGIVLSFLWPFPITHGAIRWIILPIGIILISLGIGFIAAARRELFRHGQPTAPGEPTGAIVATGVFSISRNPLYFGAVLLVAGLGSCVNAWWILIFLVPAVILCHTVLIFPEERYLSARFGDEYKSYMASVHRWLGRK